MQIIHLLPRHLDVHPPHSANDVHRQHDGAQHGELAEHVRGALLAFVHDDVELGKVIGVGAGEETTTTLLVDEGYNGGNEKKKK